MIYRNVIPKKIAEQYKYEYQNWYYTEVEKGSFKKCSRCNEVKLVSEFSPDLTKSDGFKSCCKECDRKSKKSKELGRK